MNYIKLYLDDKRKPLLITLNILLIIFIFFEVMVWNQINGLMTEEEYREARREFCASQSTVNSMSCRKPS
tara:strand:+ start:1624 stop:1833 length:210 start_codon:yes stop_codon:yes gene_type:complete